jgi:large subunit ribosomal protein L3
MSIGLLGKKLGMTRIYDEKGRVSPATVIEAGGNHILQVKNAETDGYTAVQVGYGEQKPQRVSKAMTGHFAKSSSTPKRFIREFRLADHVEIENAHLELGILSIHLKREVPEEQKPKSIAISYTK